MAGLPRAMQVQLDAAREAEAAAASETEAAPETQTDAQVDAPASTGTVVEEQDTAPQTPVASSAEFGRIEARLEALLNSVTALQTENAKLREKLEQKEKPVESEVPKVPEVQIEDLTPEERKAYAQSLPTIEKVARRLASEMTAPLRKELTELRENVKTVTTSYENSSEETFVAAVENAVPDMRKKVVLPEWKSYVESKIPRTQLTVGQALTTAHRNRDLNTIKEIFEQFVIGDKKLAMQRVPGTVRASEAPRPKETLKFSDRKQISEDFRKGRIDRKKFDELVAVYTKAEAEGRVNFDT